MRGVKRIVFDNGLVLLMEKRPHIKEAVILVGTKSGSMHESEEKAGITHFIEHMLFRSNRWRGEQEVTEELEFAGAEINAFTDNSFMTFYAKTLPTEIGRTLNIIFQAAVNDKYQRDEFSREQDDILSEIKMCIEHPSDYVYRNLFLPALFKGTPLEKTVDGSVKTVSKMTPRKLIEYKKEILIPNKPMAVIVVGKFAEDEVVSEVEKTFGSLPKGAIKPPVQIKIENQGIRKFEKKQGVEQAYLALGYQIPGYSHLDSFKLTLLQGILTAGLSSRFFQELRNKRGIGYLAASHIETFGDIGSICFMVSVYSPERVEEVESVIKAEFRDLRTNLVSSRELDRVKNVLTRQHYEFLEYPENRATQLMVREFHNVPYDYRKFEYFIRRLSARSLREAAQRYFTDDYTFVVLTP